MEQIDSSYTTVWGLVRFSPPMFACDWETGRVLRRAEYVSSVCSDFQMMVHLSRINNTGLNKKGMTHIGLKILSIILCYDQHN